MSALRGGYAVVGTAYGLWLSFTLFLQFLFGVGTFSFILSAALLLVPVFLHLLKSGTQIAVSTLFLVFLFGINVQIFVSLMANVHFVSGDVGFQWLGLILFALLGASFAAQNPALLRTVLLAFSVSLCLLLLVVLVDDARVATRLSGRLHPNLWGVVAVAAMPGLCAIRNALLRTVLVAFVFWMLLFQFNTRGAAACAAVSVIAYLYCARFQSGGLVSLFLPRTWPGLFRLSILLALPFVLASSFGFISEGLLQLTSQTRGLGSGLSGRTQLWAALLERANESPLTGVGFRMHDQFVTGEGLSSAHNAYIAMLTDLGYPGLIWYVAAVLTALWITFKRREPIFFAFIAGYAVQGFTEGRALNVGNPASILFIVLVFYALALSDQRQGESGYQSAAPDQDQLDHQLQARHT